MVTKEVLNQYIDLREEVKEIRERIIKIEKQIDRIEEEGPVVDKVYGGEGGERSYRIEGFPYPEYSRKKTLLQARKSILVQLENELSEKVLNVENFISSITDSHIRRIVRFRVVDGLSWNEVANKIGGGNTENSVRMAFNRYLE